MTFTLTISKLQVTNLCNMAWLMQTGSALNQLVQFLVPQSLSKHFTPLALIPVHKPKPRFSPNADSRSGFEVLALKKSNR